MSTDDTLPDWPPPDGEPIGEERAHAYISWIRDHARPYLEEAQRMILERYPGVAVSKSSVRVRDLATWHAPTATMPGLAIGTVHASVSGGTWAMVDILIRHDGRLIVRPGLNMRD